MVPEVLFPLREKLSEFSEVLVAMITVIWLFFLVGALEDPKVRLPKNLAQRTPAQATPALLPYRVGAAPWPAPRKPVRRRGGIDWAWEAGTQLVM